MLRDGSYDGSQNMFLWENTDNYKKLPPVTRSYLEFFYMSHSRHSFLCITDAKRTSPQTDHILYGND